MKFFLPFILISIISCNKEEIQKPFIVSEYNRNVEKHFQEAKKKNPELEKIREIRLYDYPKGKLNFIFTKDNKIYYYEEEIINSFCGVDLEKEVYIRKLSKDSLHLIKYQNIRNILQNSIKKDDSKNLWNELHPISFIFEKDTISEYNISQLLIEIDGLGFHQCHIRRIAPFEKKVLVY